MNNQRSNTIQYLGAEAAYLLEHQCAKIRLDQISTPFQREQILYESNRNIPVIRSLAQLYGHGNLGNSGYLSILPVDQGIEHSAIYSFYKNPDYFDPENIIKLAIAGGCNGVASSFGVLGMHARKYAHKIPFIVKLNHNELLTYPVKYDQIFYGTVKDAWNMGAVAVGATVYFGSPESNRQLNEVAVAFEMAHELGMGTILWCYTRNEAFTQPGMDYNKAADITGQANYLGVSIQADIIKQKLPDTNYAFKALKHGVFNDEMYEMTATDHPIDLCRLQVANCYMGKIGLLNSGGASGKSDIADAVKTAVINKRAGGSGLILGRKAFQRPFKEGVELIKTVQEVYLDKTITIA